MVNDIQINYKDVGVESFFIKVFDNETLNWVWLKFTFLKKGKEVFFRVWIILKKYGCSIVSHKTFNIKDLNLSATGLIWPEGDLGLEVVDGFTAGKVNDISWSFNWNSLEEPLKLLPPFLYSNNIPTTKLTTPCPVGIASGYIIANGEKLFHSDNLDIMQGHNWGPKHSNEYVWAQGKNNDYVIEGFSTKIFPFQFTAVGLIDRKNFGKKTIHSDILKLRRFYSQYKDLKWESEFNGYKLFASGNKRKRIMLAYENPNGSEMYCSNDQVSCLSLFREGKLATTFYDVSLEFLTKGLPNG